MQTQRTFHIRYTTDDGTPADRRVVGIDSAQRIAVRTANKHGRAIMKELDADGFAVGSRHYGALGFFESGTLKHVPFYAK